MLAPHLAAFGLTVRAAPIPRGHHSAWRSHPHSLELRHISQQHPIPAGAKRKKGCGYHGCTFPPVPYTRKEGGAIFARSKELKDEADQAWPPKRRGLDRSSTEKPDSTM